MESTVLTKVVLPLALFAIMLGMGLALSLSDFRRVGKSPKAFFVGLTAQMLFLPAVGFAIAVVLDLPPMLAVGLMIVSLCPGGTTSNLYTHFARGDLALSISLTSVSSLLAPITLPLVGSWAISYFMDGDMAVTLPFGKTVIQLMAITVVPIGVGMIINARYPAFARRTEKVVKMASAVFLFGLVALIMHSAWDQLPSFFADAGLSTLLLNLVTMTCGFGFAHLFKLNKPQSVTIGLEVGLQNSTTALLVTATILKNETMSIPPAVYALIMFATGAAFSYWVTRGTDEMDGVA